MQVQLRPVLHESQLAPCEMFGVLHERHREHHGASVSEDSFCLAAWQKEDHACGKDFALTVVLEGTGFSLNVFF